MKTLLLLLLVSPSFCYAGYWEFGFSGSYRKLNLPTTTAKESYDSTTSYSTSVAYYFAEMAAMELNYTKGQSERFIPSSTADSRTLYDFSLVGLDLIFTFAERKDPFIPYLKVGAAWFVQKEATYEYTTNATGLVQSETVPQPDSIVPSLGFGVKIRVIKSLAIKLGVEAWTSDSLSNDPSWDIAGRAGISLFL